MIYVEFTIICASILQDDDQGESVALSLRGFEPKQPKLPDEAIF